MSMRIVKLVQGTPEWHAHRRAHFNASDAPAMMACSPHKTRAQLIKELATGISEEVDAATQRRFDAGHQFEAMARPLAEEFIGDELSPCVGTEGKHSASFDGLTFMNDVAFEHKTLNNALREAMVQGCTGVDLPLQYQVQMEQQAMVSGCERILFMASTWNSDGSLIEERHCWYVPNLQLRAQIVAGWEQLEQEVTAFDPNAERQAPTVAEPVESLPAVAVQLQGSLVVVSNLDKVAVAVRAFIDGMVVKPSTDQEFADAEAECKALKSGEEAMKAAVASALAQVSDVEAFTRTANDLANLMRTTRLAREKLVAAEKDARRLAVVTDAQQDLDQHVAALNKRLGADWLPRMAGGFAETIKGKKSLANMQDAVAVAVTKAQANGLAQRLEANRAHLVQQDGDWIALFADFATVGTKAAEDFHALAALRIGNHRAAEAKRLETERERIRQEEQQRADAEMREKLIQAEAQAQAGIDEARSADELPGPLLDDLSSLAKGLRDSGVAEIDTRHAIAAAQTSAAAAASDDGRTMTLGQINALIAPIKVDAAGLAELGFVATTIKAAKHYPAGSVPHILGAMIKHLQGVMATA
jgi:putative phage-type endonuclease